MYYAAVCDDEVEANVGLSQLIKKHLPDCEVKSFMSGEALLCEKDSFDLIFLDIKMKKMNGIEAALRLREKGCGSVIIFVSAAKEYVFSAFDVGAFNYLLKPIDESKFKKVLEKAVKELSQKSDHRRFLIKTGDRSISLYEDEILYFENEMRKIIARTADRTVTFYGAMSDTEKSLGDGFFRCHRGYLVNMAHISEYSSSEITMENGDKILIAKGRYPDFIKSYHRFLRAKGAAL